MLEVLNSGAQSLDPYAGLLDQSLLEELESLGSALKGARVAHISATATGGGVAEILHSILPLYRGLGIDASWLVLQAEDAFFDVTKQMHNCLQGAKCGLTSKDWKVHAEWNRRNAALITSTYDVIIVHDPQPAAIREFARGAANKWVWRCHIDTSEPDENTWRVLSGLIYEFDAAVFSLPEFVGPGLEHLPISIMPPAIDPFTPKNKPMSKDEGLAIVARFGLDPNRPFIAQVSRFDPWKDPLGVIECFKLLKKNHLDLQLAMLGNFADDDPEGQVMYERVLEAAGGVPDLHIITGLTDLVGPFQAQSKVILQKSLREGFGLTATEALWKGTPVVAGNVGGLRLQVSDGVGGFLVDSVEECAEKVDYLLTHEDERVALGKTGRERVRAQFLLPRLLRDEFKLLHGLLSGEERLEADMVSQAVTKAREKVG